MPDSINNFDNKDFSQLVDNLLTNLTTNGLTDNQVGSVTRVLAEAFAREMAVCYQQLNRIYEMGYLDTATGAALDQVVVLLGLERLQGDYLQGKVIFSRVTPADKNINIPVGTLIASSMEDQSVVFQVIEPVVLSAGDLKVEAKIRSLEPAVTDQKPIAPYALDILPEPIYGIEQVTNLLAINPERYAETDQELQQRAKQAMRAAPKGTIASLEETIRSLGYRQFSIKEPLNTPGVVHVAIGDEGMDDTKLENIRQKLNQVKPAGIQMNLNQAKSVFISIQVGLVTTESLPINIQQTLEQDIKNAVKKYIDTLQVNESLRWAKLYNILTTFNQISVVKPLQVNGAAEYYVRAWHREDGTDGMPNYRDVSMQYLDGDNQNLVVHLNEGERIYLHPITPFTLVIEPEQQFVKVFIAGLTLEQATQCINIFQTYIKIKTNTAISLADFKAELVRNGIAYASAFTSLELQHLKDGRYVYLTRDEDTDWFNEYEKLQNYTKSLR